MVFKKHMSLERKQLRYGYIFVLPLILGLVFIYIPNLIKTFIFTMNNIDITEGGYNLLFVGITNYKKALTENPNFLIYLKDAIIHLVTNVPVVVIFSLFIAVVLNQKFKGRIMARTIFFIPVLLATGVIAKVEMSSNLLGIMDSSRIIDTGTNVDWSQMEGLKNILLGLSFNDTLISIVASTANGIYKVVQISGIQIFIILAGLQEISPSLYEAANVEGCDGWSLFWKITFPMISPQLMVCGVYTIVDTFTSSDNKLADYIYGVAFSQNQYGYATAMDFIYFLGIGLVIVIFGTLLTKFVFYNE